MSALTEKVVAEAVNALGDSTDAVAAKLRALGIKGRRGQSYRCPVARYLLRLDGCTEVSVYTCVFASDDDGGVVEMDTPEAVVAFIAAFDAGLFRDLEADR